MALVENAPAPPDSDDGDADADAAVAPAPKRSDKVAGKKKVTADEKTAKASANLLALFGNGSDDSDDSDGGFEVRPGFSSLELV
jgi:hypothetical protein